MDVIHQWGLQLIFALQRVHAPALVGFFRAITFLGEERFYLFLLLFLLWCVDFRMGVRVTVLLLLSAYLNLGLKDLFHQPRPFDLDPTVQLADAEGYGLPSGHAQLVVVVWGSLAAWARRGWLWAVAIPLMGLVGLSRVYLGVHFPSDVLAGWGIGVILLALYLAWHPTIEAWLARRSLGQQVLLAVALPLVLLLIHPTKNTTTAMATLSGAGVGLAVMRGRVPFRADGPWQQRALRLLIGGVVVLGLYLGLKAVFPAEGSTLYLPFRFVRYLLIGLWASLGAPWLFVRLRLAPIAPAPPAS